MHIQEFVLNELDPASLLNNFAQEITRSEFKQLREMFGREITEQLRSQLSVDRKKFVSEDAAQQGFMKNFFAYGGLTEYYQNLVEKDPSLENLEALDLLKQPLEVMVDNLPAIYKCNPEWPICLYDFSFRNLNPKFVAYRVKADLNSFVVQNYFSRQKLTNPNQAAIEAEREKHRFVVSES